MFLLQNYPPFLSARMMGEEVPVNLDITAGGAAKSFSIASNGAWKVTKQGAATDWVTVTPEQGDTNGEISVAISPNTNEQVRKLTLRFAVDGVQVKSIIISQLGFVPSIVVSPKLEEPYAQAGGDITFTITTNDDAWGYSIGDGADWLMEKEKTTTSLTLTVAENVGALPRTANI